MESQILKGIINHLRCWTWNLFIKGLLPTVSVMRYKLILLQSVEITVIIWENNDACIGLKCIQDTVKNLVE